ncbi:hypothetical protein LINPERHAP1_LOCUS10346 [Linum perenne]
MLLRLTLVIVQTRAELSSIVIGLERAWNLGIWNVEIHYDSACVIKLISEEARRATINMLPSLVGSKAWLEETGVFH